MTKIDERFCFTMPDLSCITHVSSHIGGDTMHTIETAIILPLIMLFTAALIFICLRYTEITSKHAEILSREAGKHTVSNTDIARGGDIIYELYREYKK